MEEDFDIACSDEELRDCREPWEPTAEEIVRLYDMLDKGELPELHWKCPGYRSPSPEQIEQPQESQEEDIAEDKDDFDFMDEVSSPKLKIRKDGQDALKGSAKKKVASMDGVISSMRRHNLLPPKTKNSHKQNHN